MFTGDIMKVKLNELHLLCSSMFKNNIAIEQFYVIYNNIKFDVIFDIGSKPFELLIGAISYNWACTLKLSVGYFAEMTDSDFFALCNILNLKPSKESLTSFKFLKFIASKAPKESRCTLVEPSHLIPFRKKSLKASDESDKIYFVGWNNHIKDKRIARNFYKTEKLLGKTVADYCREHNISSMWSANPRDANPVHHPAASPLFPTKKQPL